MRKLFKTQGIFSQVVLLAALLTLFVTASCRREVVSEATQKAGNDASASQNLSQALQLYKQRDDLRKVREGVALLREARSTNFGDYESTWRLAQFDYYLGAHTDVEPEREAAFREGIEAGKAAIQLQDGKPEGHFWLGANYGGSAEHSTLAGLSSVADIKGEMERVLSIDESYQVGSAYLGLGQLYLEAPKLMGGDHQKAVEYLEKGLRFGSNNPLLRVRLAEAYFATQRVADARKQIDFVMHMSPDPEYLPEQKEAVDKAKQLLEKMDHN